ncbi:hypothetical protein QUC31_007014 [Theobroma cacao]|uniref:SKP1/ASK-interacting protein 16 isoform 1 n=1 Tax=Theobroma cacao TaxID=3641 RepID=A0A061FTN2_THECC|nr:SKP1/ASK-interacting protein 16 isoform 1 [Theobroma cacao]
MHSLSLKVFTDLNARTRRNCFPGRVGHGLATDLDFGRTRRVGSGCWNGGAAGVRSCRIVACAVERNGNGGNGGGESPSLNPNPTPNESSFLSRSQTYATLKQQMEVAAKSEDYKEAARIRDSLKMFEEEEPVLKLKRLIREAVADERFEDAARYRDELKEIAPHSLLKCSSDATTLGIRVQVRSVYIEGRSLPSRGQYFFAYRIRITNNSDRPVQLLRRHWIITDANGKTENVWGMGVIGEQPVILPRTGFEYSSACPLSTPSGRMEGDFEMKHIDRLGSPSFNVAIAPFSLSTLGDDSDTF